MDQSKPQKFDNMVARFVFQGIFMEERVAVKHVWQKGKGVFIDLYFYRTKTHKILDTSFVKALTDIRTQVVYTNMLEFVDDYFAAQQQLKATARGQQTTDTKRAIDFPTKFMESIKPELTILYFLIKCSPTFIEIKLKSAYGFVKAKDQANLITVSMLKAYLKHINPNETDFYQALEDLVKKPKTEAIALLKEAQRITISDGGLDYTERLFLAEIVQMFRQNNIPIDIEF